MGETTGGGDVVGVCRRAVVRVCRQSAALHLELLIRVSVLTLSQVYEHRITRLTVQRDFYLNVAGDDLVG